MSWKDFGRILGAVLLFILCMAIAYWGEQVKRRWQAEEVIKLLEEREKAK